MTGHIYKIIPFLVWFEKFSPLVGKQKVPMLNDMVIIPLAEKQFTVTLYGTLLSGVALFFEWKYLFVLATLSLVVGAGMVIKNMYYTLVYETEN